MKKIIDSLKCKVRNEHKTSGNTNLIQVIDGIPVAEKIYRDEEGNRYVKFIHTCCDCGLKHDMKVDIQRSKLLFRYWRKNK